jgi:hypothetical protein
MFPSQQQRIPLLSEMAARQSITLVQQQLPATWVQILHSMDRQRRAVDMVVCTNHRTTQTPSHRLMVDAVGGQYGSTVWDLDGGASNQGSFVSPVGDMTLISNSTTAESTPSKGDIVMTYADYVGTVTVNTDIKAYCSRDNGTTYSQMTLASQGTTGGHTILTAHNVDISSQPSGTTMRYKIETLNQSATKATRIQAVSLGWS